MTHGFLAAFAEDLAELDAGPLDDELRGRTRDWVLARVGGAGAITRLGLGLTGALLGGAVLVAARRPYAALPVERRRAVARRLAATRLPLAGEYVKAVRALALTYVYDARFATAP